MTEKAARPFDIILLGATGFTGRLVAEYLIKNYGSDDSLKWAIAGRDQDKLQHLQGELAGLHSSAKGPEIFVADTQNQVALDELASKTRVVCTTVGPYDKYGSPVVEAC